MTDAASQSPVPEPCETDSGPSISREIDLFEKHMSSISDVLPAMVVALYDLSKCEQKHLSAYETKNCENVERDGRVYVRIKSEHFTKWHRLVRRRDRSAAARDLTPRILLVSLVSQYDAFLGRLLKAIFLLKPQLLQTSERQVTFEKINEFATLDELRSYILEKEIETVLRKSHLEQLIWMEKLFGIELRKGLDSLATFIEVTERRNLFVHTDGIVSSQYMSCCKTNRVPLGPEVREGIRLTVPQAYFAEACTCIHEIGVKLGHVLWRKLFPEDAKTADEHLLNYTFELLGDQKYALAERLLDLACSVFARQSAEAETLIFTVNLAQAHKWQGNEKRCLAILDATDWSAKEDKFKLANAVLRDDWPPAISLVRRIGPQGDLSREHYREWPLFQKLRQQPEFAAAFQEIFGEPLEAPTERPQIPRPTNRRKRKNDDSAA